MKRTVPACVLPPVWTCPCSLRRDDSVSWHSPMPGTRREAKGLAPLDGDILDALWEPASELSHSALPPAVQKG